MARLSDFRGRDNNFNLIRMVAALLVIEAHGCGITGHADILRSLVGLGGGDLGVDIFFILSGYLIAKSWAGKTWKQFAWARITRIYPALWVSTILSVVLVAAFFSHGPAIAFLTRSTTVSYIWHNSTMLPHFGAETTLAGAFGTGAQFNLSLWTLPYELQMYMLLAILGIVFGLRAPCVAAVAAAGAAIVLLVHFFGAFPAELDRGRFLYFFFLGALAFTLRERIILSGWAATGLTALIVLSWCIPEPVWRQMAIALSLPYLVLWCGYIPRGPLRLWNRLGDYSYGTYIFAHPINVGLFALGIAVHWWSNMLLTMAIVVPLAAISWHLLEQRALALPLPRLFRRQSEASVA
jgi:peptidoglycan/LPS O-acetylase OafA/YrhL